MTDDHVVVETKFVCKFRYDDFNFQYENGTYLITNKTIAQKHISTAEIENKFDKSVNVIADVETALILI